MQIVKGNVIEFDSKFKIQHTCNNRPFTEEDKLQIQQEIEKLLKKEVIVQCNHESREFLSPIFVVDKSVDGKRFILNLKELNKAIKYQHFKMDNIHNTLSMVTKNCFMASIDLKNAYFSVR